MKLFCEFSITIVKNNLFIKVDFKIHGLPVKILREVLNESKSNKKLISLKEKHSLKIRMFLDSFLFLVFFVLKRQGIKF